MYRLVTSGVDTPNYALLQMLSEQFVIRPRLVLEILENIRTSGLLLRIPFKFILGLFIGTREFTPMFYGHRLAFYEFWHLRFHTELVT
jgi:hypothetical protein